MKETKKNENISFFTNINIEKDKETESFKNNKNFALALNDSKKKSNNKKSLNNYEMTNLHFIQNEPILEPDNFREIFNQFRNYERKNNINSSNHKNNKGIRVITVGLNNKNSKDLLYKNSFNYNENSGSDDINSSKIEQIRILEDSADQNNRSSIPSNENRQIGIINLPSLYQPENSMNYNNNSKIIDDTIKLLGDDDNENIYGNNNNQYMNDLCLENKIKSNASIDIETLSENRPYSPGPDVYGNRSSNEIKNKKK